MSLNGIDIGDSQAYMDVKSIDGDFVIIKATQSNYYKPRKCLRWQTPVQAVSKPLSRW